MGRVFLWVGGIFAGFGVVFVAVAAWLYLRDGEFTEGAVRARGSVIQMVGSGGSDGYTYTPVVAFEDADGVLHTVAGTVSSNPPQYETGEAVEVIYPPGAPDEARIDSFLERFFLSLVFGGIGTVFTAIGGALVFFVIRHRRIAAQLRANGLPIQAKFLQCYLDTNVQVNGRSPYRVTCEATHPATGKLQSYTSDPIWIDLSRELSGREVRVLVDLARPSRHLVDLSPYVDENQMA